MTFLHGYIYISVYSISSRIKILKTHCPLIRGMATDGNCFSSKSVVDEDISFEPSSSADSSDPSSNIYVKPGSKRFIGESIYSLSSGSIRGKAMIGNLSSYLLRLKCQYKWTQNWITNYIHSFFYKLTYSFLMIWR